MEIQELLSISISALVTVVLAHLAVYWVVRTLYPPPPKVIQVPVPMAVPPPPAFTPPPVLEQQQNVSIPTYAPPVSVEAPREERKGPPAPEATSIRGKSGVDSLDA